MAMLCFFATKMTFLRDKPPFSSHRSCPSPRIVVFYTQSTGVLTTIRGDRVVALCLMGGHFFSDGHFFVFLL